MKILKKYSSSICINLFKHLCQMTFLQVKKNLIKMVFVESHVIVQHSLHKIFRIKFPLWILSENKTKSAENCGFGHTYWRNPKWKTSFFVQQLAYCVCFIFCYVSSTFLLNFGGCLIKYSHLFSDYTYTKNVKIAFICSCS